MTIEELEAEAPNLSDEEHARLWNAEAERRNRSDEVFREARKRPL